MQEARSWLVRLPWLPSFNVCVYTLAAKSFFAYISEKFQPVAEAENFWFLWVISEESCDKELLDKSFIDEIYL